MDITEQDALCGAYRYSPAGRARPDVRWVGDRCQEPPTEVSPLCEKHARAANANTPEATDMPEIEWGVMTRGGDLWRGPMTEAEAKAWVRETVEEEGITPGAFVVARRPVGAWMPERGT